MNPPDAPGARDDYLVFGRPLIGEPEIREVVDSLRSGWIGTGPKVGRFEADLASYVGVQQVRCLASCTAALMLSLRVLDIGPGDEVLVPTLTFAATINAIEHSGATPVFVDSDDKTGLINLDAAESMLTPRTRAIMPVHLWGRPVNMERLNSLRRRKDIHVIEDAAHALGAEWKGQRIGSHGNLAAYSFYVTKNITTIEGGALACADPALAERIERLALHGLSSGAWKRFSDSGYRHYEVHEPGFKFNMTDVQAALGLHQLPKLNGWIEYRRMIWDLYDMELSALPLTLPVAAEADTVHARHLYTVSVNDEAPVNRDELMRRLHVMGIGTGVHYRAAHLHPFYRDKYHLDSGAFPVATAISERTLSLPLSPAVSTADADDVIRSVRLALSGAS